MSISNTEVSRIIKKKFGELEEAINSTEKELLKGEEEYSKSKVSFHFGRVQQIYLELRFYVANKGLL